MACGSVKLVRTTNGDASVIADVPAAITTIGVLLCVAIGAVAIAAGVTPKPASTVTFSLTTSSWARRRDVSGTAASSLTITCDRLAAGLVAVLRLPQLDRGVDLAPGGGLLAGHRQDQADLHGVALRMRPGAAARTAPAISRWRRSELGMAGVSSGRVLFVPRIVVAPAIAA